MDIFTNRGGRRLQYMWNGKSLKAFPAEDIESIKHGTSEQLLLHLLVCSE